MTNVNIVFGSDFHIGNSKVSATEIHLNLKSVFYPELEKSNIVFFGGDFFDRLLKLDEPASLESITIVQELIDYAEKYNLKIRVLRGTFSHDRHQNGIFQSVLTNTKKHVDLACIDTISLELIKDLDLRVLYLPDNLPYKTKEEVMEVVNGLLKTYGWDYIDLVIGHGYFEHVFPVNVPHPPILFEYDDFVDVVKGYILMGHVHTTSVYKNIIYNGSFERLAHNEEELKGFYIINRTNDDWSHKFIENKDTPLFCTINLVETDIELLQKQIDTFVKEKFPIERGYLRIAHPDTEIKQRLLQLTHDRYPSLVVTAKSSRENTQQKQVIKQFQTCTYISPTKENLAELTLDYIKQINPTTELTEQIIKDMLEL